MVEQSGRRELLVAKGWAQAAILVTVFGFTVLLWLAYRAHVDAPPIPTQVVDPAGTVLFTGDDVHRGPADLPAQWPDGVRLDLRARRVPRPRLHGRLSAPRGAVASATSYGGAALGPSRGPDRRRLQDEPLRRRDRARCQFSAAQARRVRRRCGATTQRSSASPPRGMGCARRRSPIRRRSDS